METVRHDDRETAYRIAKPGADGPTALYVHGSGGTHQLWAHQYAPGGPTHPAVALDLSGHGDSDEVDTPAGPDTLSAYAADVTAVARETGADFLVGNSLGGAVVFEVLLETDFEPAGAVFVGSGAKLAVHERLRDALESDFDDAIEMLHRPSMLFAEDDDRLLERSVATMREVGREVTQRDFLTCHTFDVRDRLGEIDVPVLAVVGDADQLTPPSYHEYLAEQIDDCVWTTIHGAGHLAMLERPDAFNETVESFIATRDL